MEVKREMSIVKDLSRRKKLLIFFGLAVIVISVVIMPSLLRSGFESSNLELVKSLNDERVKEAIRSNMTQMYNFTELFDWEHSYLEWVPIGQSFERNRDPERILASGKGRCGEFSILYLAACYSLGYEARFLVSVNPYIYLEHHNWVEVKVDGQWIPVDPTDKVWNDPHRYKDWWGEIGKDVLIFAFEDGRVEDVTDNYV
ncbi:MAG: transglutaminase-like domain-containing protein [archaeon]